jgi:hypothetical protein
MTPPAAPENAKRVWHFREGIWQIISPAIKLSLILRKMLAFVNFEILVFGKWRISYHGRPMDARRLRRY